MLIGVGGSGWSVFMRFIYSKVLCVCDAFWAVILKLSVC